MNTATISRRSLFLTASVALAALFFPLQLCSQGTAVTYNFPQSFNISLGAGYSWGITSLVVDATKNGPTTVSNISVSGSATVTGAPTGGFDWIVLVGSGPFGFQPSGQVFVNSSSNPFSLSPTAPVEFHFAEQPGGATVVNGSFDFTTQTFSTSCCGVNRLVSDAASPLDLSSGLYVQMLLYTGDPTTNMTVSNLQVTLTLTEPTTTTIPLTFNPGSNVSQVATYNCPSGTVPCIDANAHSLRLTVPQVITPFTLTVTAYEVPLSQANGICENGQTETTDFDCRFATYFPIQTLGNGDVVVPQCIPYSNGNCVFYRVGNTPPFTSYQGPVNEYIAWNNSAYVPSGTYQANNPRLFDDPDDPPYDVNHQFVFDITNYYQPTGEEVGVDAGIGGTTKHFNDFVVAYPGAPKTAYTTSWVPPLSSTMTAPFAQGDTMNARFSLKPNTPSAIAVTPPDRVGYTVVTDSDNTGCQDLTGVQQHTVPLFHWPSEFTYDPVRQIYQLKLTMVYNPGHYKLLIDSPLFPEQCAAFVVTK